MTRRRGSGLLAVALLCAGACALGFVAPAASASEAPAAALRAAPVAAPGAAPGAAARFVALALLLPSPALATEGVSTFELVYGGVALVVLIVFAGLDFFKKD
ncbi:unnamed protein product [Effrenium voratum]|uniref:Uncharacterized protein n=1 Tax=Effrenium voratum TaxID=2562239 RepID=A0AA36MQZ8_9DINO|nr:unnamed protein product [Effrenium voratum]CAJ1428641.1 unnamed protein product [Effrenium voratum]